MSRSDLVAEVTVRSVFPAEPEIVQTAKGTKQGVLLFTDTVLHVERVVKGKNGLFVSMPRQQGKDGKWYDNVTALTEVAKEEVGRVVLEAYHQEIDEADSSA